MTLVEVMMVVFIIGLTTSLVVLTLPDRRGEPESTAQYLSRVIAQARDQAIFTGQPVGLLVEDQVLDLSVWRDPIWVERGRPELLPDQVDVEISYDQQITRPDAWPDLVFDPTGLVDPATITVRARQTDIDLTIEPNGEVRIDRP